MPDAVETLQGGPRLPGLDPEEGPPIRLEPLPGFVERPPSYEELVRLALESLLAQNPKRLREEVEEGLVKQTDLVVGTDSYVRALEATVGRRLAFRAHCFASEAADVLEELAASRRRELDARALARAQAQVAADNQEGPP